MEGKSTTVGCSGGKPLNSRGLDQIRIELVYLFVVVG